MSKKKSNLKDEQKLHKERLKDLTKWNYNDLIESGFSKKKAKSLTKNLEYRLKKYEGL